MLGRIPRAAPSGGGARACRVRSAHSLVIAICVLSAACPVAAHDPPEVWRLLWKSDRSGMVMLTNRGLIFGSTSESRYSLMCNEALGVNTSEHPDIALLDDGRLIVATSRGVKTSRDGCDWQGLLPFSEVQSPALAQHPGTRSTLYLATFEKGAGGIHESKDGGATWSRLLGVADNDFIQELVIAPSSPSTLYASGEVFSDTGEFTHYIERSLDAGKTWERTEVMVSDVDADVAALAVSPADPSVLIAKTIARNPTVDDERLLVSRDGGSSFVTAFASERIYDASFSADGASIWAGTPFALYRSTDTGQTWTRLEGQQTMMSCVTERDGVLWVCGYFGSGQDGIAISMDGGNSFESRMDFAEVSSPLTCEPTSTTAAACQVPWQDWQREILATLPLAGAGGAPALPPTRAETTGSAGAAGAAPAPALAGSGAHPRGSSSAGCAVTPAVPDSGSLLVGLLIALGLVARRRITRRH
jgi:MYXO-CTERM domain-containing protein